MVLYVSHSLTGRDNILMFTQDLVKQVGGELSGHFKETITALFDAPANYEAWSLHEALSV